MIPSIHITSIRLSITRNNDHINLGDVHLHHQFWIQCQWYHDHYDMVLCSARRTCVWICYWWRSGSILEQSQWLRSIDIISDCNSIQAALNNKDADKDKYKWAVNMYKCLTVDLFNLYLLVALNAIRFGFHIVSYKYIPSYTIFHDHVEQFHDATWVGVNSNWMSQLLYEWQKFMNSTCPFLFPNTWLSYIFQQSWKVSNNFLMVNVYTTPP